MDKKLKVISGKEEQLRHIQEIKAAISLINFLSKLLKIPFSNSKVASLEISKDIILKSTQVWEKKRELSFVKLFLVC